MSYHLWRCDDGTYDICSERGVEYQNVPEPVARVFDAAQNVPILGWLIVTDHERGLASSDDTWDRFIRELARLTVALP